MSTRPAYHPFYCEENIWHLCQHESLHERKRKYVVWITSAGEICAVWNQRAARRPGEPLGWDYHVVLLAEGTSGWEIWDLDTILPCPAPLADYLAGTFPFAGHIPEEYEPRFRIVPAETFVAEFSSDRSHMLDRRGHYRKAPPAWPPIGAGRPSNLVRYLDPDDPIAEQAMGLGQWLSRIGVD